MHSLNVLEIFNIKILILIFNLLQNLYNKSENCLTKHIRLIENKTLNGLLKINATLASFQNILLITFVYYLCLNYNNF